MSDPAGNRLPDLGPRNAYMDAVAACDAAGAVETVTAALGNTQRKPAARMFTSLGVTADMIADLIRNDDANKPRSLQVAPGPSKEATWNS